MALLCGVSWLCTVLWICICFPLQEGYSIAHASHLFPSGRSLNTNYEDDMEATTRQRILPQKDHYLDTDGEDVSPATSLDEEMDEPDMEQEEDEYLDTSSFPSTQKYEHSGSDHHPFGILVKKHAEKHVKGISFPTINNFKQFIKIMKNAFLKPGRDFGIHFDSAWDAVKMFESSGKSNLENEGTIHVDNSKNDVWKGQDASYKMPDKRLFFVDPDSSESLISSNASDNQEFRPRSSTDEQHYLAATERDSSNVADEDFPGGYDDIFLSAPKNEHVQSTSNDQLEQIQFPSDSFFGEDYSFTAASLKHPGKSSQDFSHDETSSLTPPELNIPKSKYMPHSEDYLKNDEMPSAGFDLGKNFHRVIQPDVPHAQQPALLNYHGRPLYAPINRLPKRKIPAKYSQNVNYTPIIYQPRSGSSVSASSSSLLPQESIDSVGIQTNIPHELQNQTDMSHLVSTTLYGTSMPTEEKLDVYTPNLVPVTEELNDDTTSSGIDSPQSGIPSYKVKNLMRSFSMPQTQGISPDDINVSVMKMLPASVNREHRNFPYWISKLMSAPRASALSWIDARNGGNRKSLPPRWPRNMSPLFQIAYYKSSNRYARAKAFQSKTRYTPY